MSADSAAESGKRFHAWPLIRNWENADMSESSISGINVLVLEDDPWERKQLVGYLKSCGSVLHQAEKIREAREILHDETIDFALLDIQVPDGSGVELLEEGKILTGIPTVFVTSQDSVELAVRAMKAGAEDFLVKPCPVEKLEYIYESWKRRSRGERREDWSEKQKLEEDKDLYLGAGWGRLGDDLERLLEAESRLERQLPPVLITGETGTGKSTLARYLHRHGPRARSPFVEVNASHLSSQLAESELFGHEKGAFTDARERKLGLFEAADGGTLFLDEITQLDPSVQAKLLTVLESGTFRRVGGVQPISVDVRLIVATNAHPEEEVKTGHFREDLFHRLSLVRLHLPPLRETSQDLPALARHLLNTMKDRYNRPDARLTDDALERIKSYPWQGNIRELRHELERALIFSDSEEIDLPGLPESWTESEGEGPRKDWLNTEWTMPEEGFSLDAANETFIQMAMEKAGNNLSAAARMLGIPRHILRYRLQGKKGM